MYRTILAVAVAAAAAGPPTAHGATLHQDGRSPHRLLLQDATGETNLISVQGSRSVVIEDANAPIEIAGVPTCMPIDPWTVSCASVRRLELDLGAASDFVSVSTPREVEIEGGAGNDRYVALAGAAPSRVTFSGGIGRDVANYGYATSGVAVSVDLEGGDGRPGDEDRILRDVEMVFGSAFDDELRGSHRTEELRGFDGDDRITGGTAAESLLGGPGQDRIEARDGAADSLDCGGQLFDVAFVDAVDAIAGCAEVNS